MKQNLDPRRSPRLRDDLRVLHAPAEGGRRSSGPPPCSSPAFMVFRWASTPNYAPLYSNLASEDASAIIDQLDADGRPLRAGQRRQHDHGAAGPGLRTRIALGGKGLPGTQRRRLRAARRAGHLDLASSRSRPTSSARWRASSPRPSRRSTASTPRSCTSRCREAGLRRRAGPDHRVGAGRHLAGHHARRRAGAGVVNLVASSIDGLDPTSHRGRLQARSSPTDGVGGVGAGTRAQRGRGLPGPAWPQQIQTMLDQVLGAGQLDRPGHRGPRLRQGRLRGRRPTHVEPGRRRSRRVDQHREVHRPGSRQRRHRRRRPGRPDGLTTGQRARRRRLELHQGVRRPATTPSRLRTEHREAAPGSVQLPARRRRARHRRARHVNPATSKQLIAATVGIDAKRGDTVEVS